MQFSLRPFFDVNMQTYFTGSQEVNDVILLNEKSMVNLHEVKHD